MEHSVYICAVIINNVFMEKKLTQAQAEEQCRILRLKRSEAVRKADEKYETTIQKLFEQYKDDCAELETLILNKRAEIGATRIAMTKEYDEKYSEQCKNNETPVMGIVIAPYKERLEVLQAELNKLNSQLKMCKEKYRYDKQMASIEKERANREAADVYLTERTELFSNVSSDQENWKQKYEELKKQMEGAA